MKDDREVNETMREMLAELDAADARAVEPLLLSLKRMASGDAPPPSPQVFAAFTARVGGAKSTSWASRHKGAIFSIALVGALGAGTSTAAALSPAFRAETTHLFHTIVNSIPFVPHSTPNTGDSAPIGPGTSTSVSHLETTPSPTPDPQGDDSNNGNPDSNNGNGDSDNGNSSSNNGNPDSNNGNPDSNNGNPDSNNGNPDSNNGNPDSNNGNGGKSAEHANPNSTTHPTPNRHSTTHGKNG